MNVELQLLKMHVIAGRVSRLQNPFSRARKCCCAGHLITRCRFSTKSERAQFALTYCTPVPISSPCHCVGSSCKNCSLVSLQDFWEIRLSPCPQFFQALGSLVSFS